MKPRYRGLLLICLLINIGSCTWVGSVERIKLGHGLDTQHPVHLAMEFMAERVAELSGGELQIDIYPNEQLGTERQSLELLQVGSLGMTKVSAAVLENFAPNLKVLSLPYIFSSREHRYKVLDSAVGEQLLQEPERFWLRGLTYYDAGSRSFYSKDFPIQQPTDLSGKKIRVQPSATAMALVRAMGASPTPIAWGELYTALQQGVVDGAENNPPSFYYSRHYEVCRYYSLNEHTAVPDMLVISTHWWQRLTERQQQWLQQAATESKAYQRKLWQTAEQEALAAVIAAGVTVLRPRIQDFAAQTKTLLQRYAGEPAIGEYIARIQALESDLGD